MENYPRSWKQIGKYVVQCGQCFKWSSIPSLEDYEIIREKWTDKPWQCYRNLDLCNDHIELEEPRSENELWVIDAHDIPRTPPGCKRNLIMRGDYAKMDVTYLMPPDYYDKTRSLNDVLKFLEMHPRYETKFLVGNFSFTGPRIPTVVPPHVEDIISDSRMKKKQRKEGIEEQPSTSSSALILSLLQEDMQQQQQQQQPETEIVSALYAKNSGVRTPRSRGSGGPAVPPTIPEHW